MRLFTALTLALCLTFAAHAEKKGTEATVKLKQLEDSKVQLIYGSTPEGPLLVKIYDSKHSLVHMDRIKAKKAFSKAYDFSKLAPGKYQVGIYNTNGEIDHLDLELEEKNAEPVVYSKLDVEEGNKYKLLVNSLLPTDMSVMIYENNVLVHSEKLHNTKGFKKTYVFSNDHFRNKSNVEFYIQSENGFSKLIAAK
ncbi:hypothetical protein MM239_14605 [Belliella sp. DSM 111904]|uniref:DUF4397 domain-containing protein n=1 Tax=Belliella filtrata TaxID=2923435 RepID=A0ABS9V2J5_9BACT|nr:hypothetical protein [Belliella filtrata]MCH7410636.1 hypothetical protein [Belliella filtrata]